MERNPLVSIVIPTRNRKNKLIRLLASIMRSSYPADRLEVIVIDDASTDGTYHVVRKEFPKVKLLRNETVLVSEEII